MLLNEFLERLVTAVFRVDIQNHKVTDSASCYTNVGVWELRIPRLNSSFIRRRIFDTVRNEYGQGMFASRTVGVPTQRFTINDGTHGENGYMFSCELLCSFD